MQKIGIVGGGAWGTALAAEAARAGREVTLWALEPEVAVAINSGRENKSYLPGVTLPPFHATGDLAGLAASEAVLLVPPAQHMRKVCLNLAPHLGKGVPAVICAKGIENESLQLMSEVVAETLPGHPIAVLSGPTFAIEVAKGLPAAVTIACADEAAGRALVSALGTPAFRPYWTDDVIGAEIGGAVKNVLAIACGIVAGRALGENARAAVITRGMAEMMRFAVKKGARPETLMGLSGLGDLILTCSSTQSRNFSLGKALGEGRTLAAVLAERISVAEGVWSASSLYEAAKVIGADMPIANAVHAILHKGVDVEATIAALLARPFTREN